MRYARRRMRRSKSVLELAVLVTVVAGGCFLGLGESASADVALPTPAPVVTVSPPTAVVTPDVPLTPTVQVDVPPTPARERVRLIPTVAEGSTAAEVPTPTIPTRGEQGHMVPSVPTFTPTPATDSQTRQLPPVAPLPSPAQLRENARLRWGHGVPGSVRRWAFLIVPAAHRYGLSPGLIAAVMTMESDGDPLAYSAADARGLMQVLHGPWDPRENVFTGARMLAMYHSMFPDWTLTLAAYNAGPNAVSSYNGVPPFRETRDYVIVVTYLWDLYSHKHLSVKREALYHSTLRDMQHFVKERKKVVKLAQIAHIHDERLLCSTPGCASQSPAELFATLDPFWPLPGAPDPLQKVDPYAVVP